MNKRLFDIVFSVTGLVFLLPFMLVIMMLIVVFDGGSPFFIQKRIGQNGRPFRIIKFKTMKPGSSSGRNDFEAGQTSRITRLGKFLRRYKLDEIPQLINVLKGEMSLVGPRPEVEKWTQVYSEKWKIVHLIKPGITDNTSILFRNEEELLSNTPEPEVYYRDDILPRKLDMYTEYVYNQSFANDLAILFRTIKSVWIN
jgi:lipopolysaccharide/colanic/teichoic acid biosynthesis glycosyltransferase